VGNNGAGKTTMLSLLLDLIKPTQGEVYIKDQNVRISEDWKHFTTAFLDESFLINFLTPDEYFAFVGGLYGWSPTRVQEYILKYEEFFNDEIIGKKKYIRDLSKGNQKKVGLIGSFIGDPEIIVLDEPFSNLDPTSQIRLKRIIDEVSDKKTMIMSSHDLNHITDICRRVILLDKGIVAKDTKKDSDTLKQLEAYFAA
jgi:ABC-2 type transport system ATP-binding protein